jgi:hypothetical protein
MGSFPKILMIDFGLEVLGEAWLPGCLAAWLHYQKGKSSNLQQKR